MKIIVFNKRRPKPEDNVFVYNGEILKVVDQIKYLGVIFKFNNNFDVCKKSLCEQGQKAMFSLLGKSSKFNLDIPTQLELFEKVIQPICLYGCEAWGASNNDVIEKLHLKFLKYILKVKTSTPSIMVYGETGMFPMDIAIKQRMLNFWFRIVIGKIDKFTTKMYNVLLNLFNNNIYKSPWLSFIQKMLDDTGMSFVWNRQDMLGYVKDTMSDLEKASILNINYVKEMFKRNLKDQFIQKWRMNLNNTEMCCLYTNFKVNFECEEYLSKLPNKLRILFTKFRICNTKLPIEKGRYQNIPRFHRFCNLCNEQIIGDEFHFILECKALADIRKLYIPIYYYKYPNMIKFIEILSTNHTKLLFKISKFLQCTLIFLK